MRNVLNNKQAWIRMAEKWANQYTDEIVRQAAKSAFLAGCGFTAKEIRKACECKE